MLPIFNYCKLYNLQCALTYLLNKFTILFVNSAKCYAALLSILFNIRIAEYNMRMLIAICPCTAFWLFYECHTYMHSLVCHYATAIIIELEIHLITHDTKRVVSVKIVF